MAKNVRVIARLDIKGANLIKGIQLEGLRVLGLAEAFAAEYYRQGADELIFLDHVASLYQRDQILAIVESTANQIFVPLTVGGGIRSLDDVYNLLRAGADKIAINTAAINNPDLINQAAKHFGSQCIVISIEAKRLPSGGWEAFTDAGREHSGRDVTHWAQEVVDRGAGEILLTSVDRDGTKKGFDTDLVRHISSKVSIPVIASGGAGCPAHCGGIVTEGLADAVAIGSLLHYKLGTISDIKQILQQAGVGCRPYVEPGFNPKHMTI